MKKLIKVIFGVLISIVFLYLTFRQTNFNDVIALIKEAKIKYLALSFLFAILGLMIRSYRFKLLGRNYALLDWIHFFRSTTMGLMFNIILPFRSGDFFQSYHLSTRCDLPKSYTLSTVVLERFIDFLVTVTIIMVSSCFYILPDEIRISGSIVTLIIFLVLIYVLIYFHEPLRKMINKMINARHTVNVERILGNIVMALDFLNSKQVLRRAMPLSFFNLILIYGCSVYFSLKALNIDIGYSGALLVMAITLLSAAIPSSPGQVGTWEYFCFIALSIFNIDKTLAASYAILGHMMALLPTILIGGYFCINEFILNKNPLPSDFSHE